MKLETPFNIGQTIYYAGFKRVMEMRPCVVCGGSGRVDIIGADGSKHKVRCPAANFDYDHEEKCRDGEVKVGICFEAEPIRVLTVGQIQMRYGGLVEPDGEDRTFHNIGEHEHQSYEREDGVMCYETGIGSGSVYRTEPREGDDGGSAIFATEEAALKWVAGQVTVRNVKATETE